MTKLVKGLMPRAQKMAPVQTVVQKSAPTVEKTTPTPLQDVAATEEARKRRLMETQQRGGVMSTNLSGSDTLGG